jgi:NAD(P)-dependent dehydrogenase (short-subunit alcohol dehydrogenase family)
LALSDPKRVLLLGAETVLGAAAAEALAEAGARLALVSSTADGDAAFRVQRLARNLGAISQAIDATNETAVRVMVRQVSKELGGLDATVVCVEDAAVKDVFERTATREMQKRGEPVFIDATVASDLAPLVADVTSSG